MSDVKTMTVLLAEFDNPAELIHAAEKTRDAGYKNFDCHSPFPIHGMDTAMGEQRSPLGFIVFIVALLGVGSFFGFIWWLSVLDYPMVISGKPYGSFQAWVPPLFAITILSAALTAVFGMFHINRIPRLHHPLFNSTRFEKASDNAFFLSIESNDPMFSIEKTKQFLASIGGKHVEELRDK
jgi:Protein of unknown function (DUF3341)